MTTQSDIFDEYMRAVWNDQICDMDDDSLYDERHDARETIGIFGAKPTGNKHDDGDTWNEFLFPDGSIIWVNGVGSGLSKDPT